MKKRLKINILNVLLVLTAIAMFIIGLIYNHPAPAVTGIGFVLIAWIIHTQNNQVGGD